MTPRALGAVPLAAALLPAVTIHLCYVLAATHGHVTWCIPYWDSCVSISATGRHSPESYVFRALMIPTAVLFMFYWLLSHVWLRALGGAHPGRRHLMLALGVAGAVGLVLYTTVLGSEGRVFFIQRRAGVTSFYIMTVLAQCILTLEVLAFEWVITVLILGHALVTHFAWRQSGFTARFTVGSGPGEDPVDRL